MRVSPAKETHRVKYSYKVTFDLESNIMPQFVQYALQSILEKEKISVIQGQAEPLKDISIVEVKK